MRHCLIGLCLILAACGTPQERCLRSNTTELRTVLRLIEETEANLARGYGYETVIRDVSFGLTYCTGSRGAFRFCADRDTYTDRRPVAIDPELETRKLSGLKLRETQLRTEAAPKIAACRQQFPR